jgi:chromate transporter
VSEALGLFLVILKAAALSIGGIGSLPLLRQELVGPGLLTERQVVEALAIGRLTTGPSGLYVVSLGYFALGWAGAALALLAASIPPLLLVPAAAMLRKQLLSAWVAGIVRGIALSTSGLTLATGVLLVAPDVRIFAVPLWQLALAAIACALTLWGRLHPGVLVVAGAVVGIALGR